MSDQDRFDELMRVAFHDARTIEPTEPQIAEVVRRANTAVPVRRRVRRQLTAAAAAFALLAGTAVAVPQTREALFNGFGAFKEFFTGGGDPPGTPIPTSDDDAALNWFRGTDTTNGAIIAQAQSVRLVAYRQTTTGMACFAYGTSVSACRPDKEWIALLADSPVLLTGPFPEADASGRLPLFGVTADRITTIKIQYVDGGTERSDNIRHGFVLFADPTRRPTTLTARDKNGAVVTTTDIRDRQWEFNP